VENWSNPTEYDLPEAFRGPEGVGLARDILNGAGVDAKGEERKSPLHVRLEELELKVDSLFSYLNSALQTTNAASDTLDARFSILSLFLASRSQPIPPTLSRSFSHASLALAFPYQQHDPQDILRTLSCIDIERPPAEIGDEARRAVREVQRVNEGGGLGERRLTITTLTSASVGVTPRKGALRRPTTPGRTST